MTETKKPTVRQRQAAQLAPDPKFVVITERPKPEEIVTARNLNNPPTRMLRPLTNAVMKTLSGGSVQIDYDKDEHARLLTRFKSVGARQDIDIHYSFVLPKQDENEAPKPPTHIRYWAEKKNTAEPPPPSAPPALPSSEPAPAPAPPAPAREPVVGRDCE